MTDQSKSSEIVAQLCGVEKNYGDVQALSQLDLNLNAGEVTSVLGPNGAGKTTLIELLLGMQQPNQGHIKVFSHPPQSGTARKRLGAMLQISGVPDTLKVDELINMFRLYYPNPFSLAQIVRICGLDEVKNRRYGHLSGGQQRRVQFALAICGQPELLFLDEPTVGMDVAIRREFWETIRRLSSQGCAVILTTHYLEEADALSDRIILLNAGEVIADGRPELIKSLVTTKRIHCRTGMSLEQIRAIPGVCEAEKQGERICIHAKSAEQVLKTMLNKDPEIMDLEVGGADLEQAFLNLTGASSS